VDCFVVPPRNDEVSRLRFAMLDMTARLAFDEVSRLRFATLDMTVAAGDCAETSPQK